MITYRINTAQKIIHGVVRTVIYKQFWDSERKETRIRFAYSTKRTKYKRGKTTRTGGLKIVECSSCKFFRKYIGVPLVQIRDGVRKIVENESYILAGFSHSWGSEVTHIINAPTTFVKELPRTEKFSYPKDEFICGNETLIIEYLRHYHE